MSVYTSVEELIGRTPLLELGHIQQKLGLKARLLAKLEGFNPGGSAKDRVAKAMLDAAEEAGLIQPGALIYCLIVVVGQMLLSMPLAALLYFPVEQIASRFEA